VDTRRVDGMCAHTLTDAYNFEGWGSPNGVQIVLQKIGEDNRKARKTDQTVSQTPTLGLKHDKIWAQWPSDVHWRTC
jgi:hypothetical protein